jgi:hypothetical protein
LVPIKCEKRLSIVVVRIAVPWQTRDGTKGSGGDCDQVRGEAKCNLWRFGNT